MAKQSICPNCHTLEPLAHRFEEYPESRYTYPNKDRLYAGIEVARVLSYSLDHEHIDCEDFDSRFGEWLDWASDDGEYETKTVKEGEHYLTRRITRFCKRCVLACGCVVTFELNRDASASHKKIDHTFDHCAAHATNGYAMDKKGRCYVCEWPITAFAKGVTTKLNKADPTYTVLVLAEETEKAAA